MAHTRRKRRANIKKKRFSRYRGKGIYHRPPSYLPIPPPQAPSLPIPPPRAPSPPALLPYLPIPPPPNPLFIEPSPNHFIIRPPSPQQQTQKKPKAKQPKSEPKPYSNPVPEITQQRRSLRQIINKSEQNKKIKRR
jgi:hypothetical protein